jgi:hypothetical protein
MTPSSSYKRRSEIWLVCMHQQRDQAVCAVYSGYASLLRNQRSIDRMTDWHSDAGIKYYPSQWCWR